MNGQVVRYVRAPKPPAKVQPKPRHNRNLVVTRTAENATNAVALPQCSVVCINMTNEEIAKEIEKFRILNKQQPNDSQPRSDAIDVADGMDNFQEQPNDENLDLSCVQRRNLIKIVVGKNTFFIANSVFCSVMPHLRVTEPAANFNNVIVGQVGQQANECNFVELFGKISLNGPKHVESAEKEPKDVEPNLSWIHRSDTMKIVIGKNTFFITSAVFRSIMMHLHLAQSAATTVNENHESVVNTNDSLDQVMLLLLTFR